MKMKGWNGGVGRKIGGAEGQRARGGRGGMACMHLLFYETSNKCGAVSVIGSTLSLSGALLLPL